MSLGDCTFPQHLETTKFKELLKMHDLPFISALGHFFFSQNFPSLSKYRQSFCSPHYLTSKKQGPKKNVQKF